jgi:hypothetical protein
VPEVVVCVEISKNDGSVGMVLKGVVEITFETSGAGSG